MSEDSALPFSETVKYRALTLLVQELTFLIDSGKHDSITVADAVAHIEAGDLFVWLKALEPERLDFSLFGAEGPYYAAGAWWLEGLGSLLKGYRLEIGRKWGIEHRGLCLLLAWSFEVLRHEIDRITDEVRKSAKTGAASREMH